MISLSTLFVNELRFDNRFFSIKRTYYYVSASVEFEPATLRTKGDKSTNEPPCL